MSGEKVLTGTAAALRHHIKTFNSRHLCSSVSPTSNRDDGNDAVQGEERTNGVDVQEVRWLEVETDEDDAVGEHSEEVRRLLAELLHHWRLQVVAKREPPSRVITKSPFKRAARLLTGNAHPNEEEDERRYEDAGEEVRRVRPARSTIQSPR